MIPVLAALAALVAAPAAQARIAFTAASEGEFEVAVVAPDGSGRQALIPQAHDPDWSRDGRRLAVARPEGDNESGIWVAAGDGSGLRRLTGGAGYDAEPAWGAAPSGGGLLEPPGQPRIAFTRVELSEEDARIGVWTMAADGSGLRRVTGEMFAHAAAWSPDGRQIAFTAINLLGEEIETDVYVVDADGGRPRLLVSDAAAPAWSPDGRRLAFESRRDRNGEHCDGECWPAAEIYVMDLAGGAPARLTADPAEDVQPAWSPDGSAIVFASDRFYPAGESHELHAMRADGSCAVRITAGAARALAPAWQPGTPASVSCEQPALSYAGPDLEPLRRYGRLPLLWLGESFRGLVPSSAQVLEGPDVPRLVDVHYADCIELAGRCPAPIELQMSSVCDSNPLSFDVLPDSRAVVRGALVERHRGGVSIYTGGLSVEVDTGGRRGPSRSALRRIIAALRPVTGPARLGRRLPPPVFPRSVLRRVRRIEVTVRRHGIEEARRRLRLSRSALRDRVRLARVLRSLPRPTAAQRRAARCRPDPLLDF